MERSPGPSFQPVGAGAFLVATTMLVAGVGALVGWALGSVEVGVIVGVIVGVPAGVLMVYYRYRRFLS
jgi:F0F1-type ATP synthase assembly protein I